MTPADSISLSQKYFPNLVDGTGDKTLYIFSISKNLWERVTEGRCCLDGWEADLSWKKIKSQNIALGITKYSKLPSSFIYLFY